MHINLEVGEQHAVQSYSDKKIQINSIIYDNSLIVSREEIITDLAIKNIQDIDDEYFNLLIKLNPEIIIIGHENMGKFPPINIISQLSQHRIGIECMSIGAACRTFNVLLSEHRAVIAGFII
jgi:uncharacterized protein